MLFRSVQKTGMEDVALRPRFRTAQRRGAELSQVMIKQHRPKEEILLKISFHQIFSLGLPFIVPALRIEHLMGLFRV